MRGWGEKSKFCFRQNLTYFSAVTWFKGPNLAFLVTPEMFFQVLDGLNTLVIGSEAIKWVESEKSKILNFRPNPLIY